MKKKLTSILVLCIISFTLTLPVSAAQTVSKGIQPRVQECGNCGKMSLNTVKLNSYEKGPIIRKCTHGRPYGTDKVYKIYITYQYKCAHCSYKSSTWDIATSDSNDKVECHGYY